MFIQRDFTRTEHDDFVLHVERELRDEKKEAVPIYNPEKPDEQEILGWKIQNKYE